MIRKTELADVPRISEIHVFGWRDAYRGIVPDDYLFNTMLVAKRINYFAKAVHDCLEEIYVYDDGIVKAFMTIGACRDTDMIEAFELWGLYVDPFMQRQGIGTEMLDFCETKAIERGHTEVCIWVFEQNKNAIKFYETHGYSPDGTKKPIDAFAIYEVRYLKQL